MRKALASPLARATAFAVAVVAGAFALGVVSRLGSDERGGETPTVVALEPSDVRQVVVAGSGRDVTLTRSQDGTWSGGEGVPPEVETLMLTFEERLFPLPAFRQLAVDASSPRYGLVDPEITFEITDDDGDDHRVLFGAPTFTDGGVYARKGAEARQVYLVPRRMMDDLRSLVAGRRVDRPNDVPEKVAELDEAARRRAEEANVGWWLEQALESGAPVPEGLE